MVRIFIIPFLLTMIVIAGCAQSSSYQLPSWQAGQWVEYKVTTPDAGSAQIRYSIVGEDNTEGVRYFWFETCGKMETSGFIFKMMVPERFSGQARRVIIKIGNEPAVEMPLELSEPPEEYKPKLYDETEIIKKRVNTEKVKTPAGEFRCIHSRIGEAEVWVSSQIPILGIVKYETADEKMELTGFGLSGAQTLITELPQRLDLDRLFGQK